ncbi:MAG: hypothetical protein M9947_01755 [Thermomicrobiales bacterium]|nr:hypothetical protein [Thermomicrobiales bacterium]
MATDELADLLQSVESGTRALEIDGRRIFGYTTRYFDDAHTAYYRVRADDPTGSRSAPASMTIAANASWKSSCWMGGAGR